MMVKRIAKAIHGVDVDWLGVAAWHVIGLRVREYYRHQAHAALEAMSDPTEAMELAGRDMIGITLDAGEVWRAMHDIALSETDK